MKNRLKEIRKEKGMTAMELAKMVGVDEKHIYRIERGSNPSFETAIKIANILNKNIEDIWDIEKGGIKNV